MTDKQTVIERLTRAGVWVPTYDFTGDKYGNFLSHRGPARISELSLAYPEMIETDTTEKVYRYRFRFENSLAFLPKLPPKMAEFVKEKLKENGRNYQKEVIEPVYIDDNTVRMIRKIKTI